MKHDSYADRNSMKHDTYEDQSTVEIMLNRKDFKAVLNGLKSVEPNLALCLEMISEGRTQVNLFFDLNKNAVE